MTMFYFSNQISHLLQSFAIMAVIPSVAVMKIGSLLIMIIPSIALQVPEFLWLDLIDAFTILNGKNQASSSYQKQ